MTIGKAVLLAAGFVGAVALGVAVGPTVRHALPHSNTDAHSIAAPAPAADSKPAPAAVAKKPHAEAARSARASSNTPITAASETSTSRAAAIPPTEPRLYDRLKPVLNRGARMNVAADGFRSAEEFATVAHAAHDTHVPFLVLKHRVLTEHRSLADAIHQANPNIDAKAAVTQARAEAKADMQAIAGNAN
jgi:hypothetical protein